MTIQSSKPLWARIYPDLLDKEKVIDALKKGGNLIDASRIIGCCDRTFKNALKYHHISRELQLKLSIRKSTRGWNLIYPDLLDKEKVVAAYKEGKNQLRAACIMGCSDRTFRKALKYHGINVPF